MLGGADNPNGELPSYITGADTKQKVEFYLTARKICISLFYHSYIFIQTINFFLIIMIKVLIVNRCRASGMEGGTPLFHMIPE
ncbi:TPA: hypothetical protein IVA66_24055 [Escherichia coli]|nr:hypothetical protein [Escherichia coli]